MPSLRQLRYFVTVAEEGQMTGAAGQLHLAQPALSQAIAQLELRLGIQLLERRARGVALTAGGEAFLPKARLVLDAVDDANRTARALVRTARSAIEWGFIGSPPMVDAPELFAAFVAAHPDVKVSFRELAFPCGSPSSWLADVDVALCYSPTPHPHICIHELRSEPASPVSFTTFGLWLSLRQVSVSLAGFASRNGTAMTSVSPLRTFAALEAGAVMIA